ncbi:MAG TPA: multicopper oxidase domain-containing protein [Actinopolymorphaceae bacterium]
MSLTRRGFLGALGVTGVAAALGGCGVARIDLRPGVTGELLRSNVTLPKPFTVPLPIPPVKKPSRSDRTTDYYDIVQRASEVEILPGRRTAILGYDGIFPGPTLSTRSGRRTVVRHRNELSVPVTVHLHGGHTPATSDGGPLDLILPHADWRPRHAHDGGPPMPLGDTTVGSREYVYPLEQRAATLWYHDHRMDFTAPQVYRGLAGFHLVHDDEEDALPLPRGERDIPLMICDRAFEADGSFRYPAIDRTLQATPGVLDDYMEGVLGDTILVNGAPWPELEVDRARYRFRILNASNARRYRLALDRGAELVQIGSDHGLLERPVTHQALEIAPAERFDVVVDFSRFRPGTTITMTNGLGTETTSNVMRFRVTSRRVDDDARVPARLSRIERLDPAKAVRTRTWRFTRGRLDGKQGWVINGKPFDPRRMDARPRLGDVEIWRFVTDLHHPVHIHLDPFQVVRRGGKQPSDYDGGWKDTVDVRPTEQVEVAIRFTDYEGTYMLHCHNLEHEDMAMMSAFETVSG